MIDTAADFANAHTDFGSVATLSVGGTAAGILDTPYAESFGLVSNPQKVFIAETADLSAVTVGSTLTISSTAYTVTGIEPDGTGMTRVTLK